MKRRADKHIEAVRSKIKEMGRNVQDAIDAALNGLSQRSNSFFEQVYEIEHSINQTHKILDEMCIDLLAVNAPLAADLRFIISVIKVNNDLERMGDLAVNIAHNGERYIQEPPLKPLVDLPSMADEVKIMVSDSLISFLEADAVRASTVLRRDDLVDLFKNNIMKELVEKYMKLDPATINRSLDLILIARNLERIGDHATNIAEDAIYVAEGIDVRHGSRTNPPAGKPDKITAG